MKQEFYALINHADKTQMRYDNKKYPYSDLTENIIGCVFRVYNTLGYGLREKLYQAALEEELKNEGLVFSREKYGKLMYNGKQTGKYFLDFYIDNRVAVELKVKSDIYSTDVGQLLSYIKSEDIPVGILAVFSKYGVKIKRLANTISDNQRS